MNSKFDVLECICDTCAGDGSICYMVGALYAKPGADFSKACNRYRRRVVTNYERLFGMPERAARSISDACEKDSGEHGGCGGCPVVGADCGCGDYDALLEWLESEVRE